MKDGLKQIYVFDSNHDTGDWPPDSPKEFLKWFEAKFAEIPDEHKHRAKVVMEGAISGYDDPYVDLGIYYHRPLNAEEAKHRKKSQAIIDRQDKENELYSLSILLKKHYGPNACVVDKEK